VAAETLRASVESSDGIGLYAERNSPAEGGESGHTVVFSCAYSTTHENWRSQVGPLTEAGHCVVLWDYRGHGRSEVPEDPDRYSMEQVVDDLGLVLEWAAPDEPVVLAGLSFGGLASLHYTYAHAHRVEALILAGSGPGFKNADAADEWRRRSEKTADYIESKGMEAFVTGKAAPTCIGHDPELPAARHAAAAIAAQDPRGVANFGRRVAGLAPSIIDELPEIDQPALVLVGEHDRAYLRAAEVMSAKLPRASHQQLPDAGHIGNIEQTEAFNRILLEFLAQLDSADWSETSAPPKG
jgi:pimeloyl-ACP methyl ester carboxylesterase